MTYDDSMQAQFTIVPLNLRNATKNLDGVARKWGE
jgi:hypothetical protein